MLALLLARGRMAKAVFNTAAPRKSTGEQIRGGYHREVRQRIHVDEFGRVVEQCASDDRRFTDDCREQSDGQLHEQRNRGRGTQSVQGMIRLKSKLTRTKVGGEEELRVPFGKLKGRCVLGRQGDGIQARHLSHEIGQEKIRNLSDGSETV